MADPYLAVAAIANDEYMLERLRACVTQQAILGSASVIENDPANQPISWAAISWVDANRYVWASSPDWGAAWASALAGGNEEPGKDESVITDGMILATVQALTNPAPPEPPEE